jgi:hypothetical protein
MSGHKHATVTIRESEYRRLHDIDMKSRFSLLGRQHKEKDQKENEVINAMVQAFDKRQNEFESYIDALNNEIVQIEKETAQALEQQQNNLSVQLASLKENSILVVNEYIQSLSEKVDSCLRRHQNELSEFRQNLEMLSGNMADKNDLAESWLTSANTLRSFIETHYDHASWLPGQFEQIDLQLQQASGNLAAGMPEAALVLAQQAYMAGSQARIEMERLISQWQILFQVALQAVEDLYHDISANNYIPALDINGSQLPILIDLDHWSVHRYTNMLRSVKSYLSRLRTASHRITSTELKDLIQNIVPRFRQDFDEIIYEARLDVIYSQIRINIADIAIQALGRQGFVIQEHGYTENDMRKPYFISLLNIEGSRVTILVNPMKDTKAANDLVINSFDTSTRTESELRSRSREIVKSLAQFGLQVGPLTVDNDTTSETFSVVKKEPARSKSFIQ